MNFLKNMPGTIIIVLATILGVVLTSIMFPERSQLIITLGVVALVCIVAFRAHKVAGIVVTGACIIALAFWGPSVVQEFNRANNPNGTFASYFAKAKEQTTRAGATYKPGAVGQASLLSGVMSSDAKLSANLDQFIIRTGSTIADSQLVLVSTQVDSLMHAANVIKQNQETFTKILVAGGVVPNAPAKKTADTLSVNVASTSPASIDIPEGHDAVLTVRYARYSCDVDTLGASGRRITPNDSKASYPTAFVAPHLSAYALLYRVDGGPWNVLDDGITAYVKGDLDDDVEVEFLVNDRKTTFDDNTGKCVVGYELVPVSYASR